MSVSLCSNFERFLSIISTRSSSENRGFLSLFIATPITNLSTKTHARFIISK